MSLSLITKSLYHLNHKLLTAIAYYLADKWFGGQYNIITIEYILYNLYSIL